MLEVINAAQLEQFDTCCTIEANLRTFFKVEKQNASEFLLTCGVESFVLHVDPFRVKCRSISAAIPREKDWSFDTRLDLLRKVDKIRDFVLASTTGTYAVLACVREFLSERGVQVRYAWQNVLWGRDDQILIVSDNFQGRTPTVMGVALVNGMLEVRSTLSDRERDRDFPLEEPDALEQVLGWLVECGLKPKGAKLTTR